MVVERLVWSHRWTSNFRNEHEARLWMYSTWVCMCVSRQVWMCVEVCAKCTGSECDCEWLPWRQLLAEGALGSDRTEGFFFTGCSQHRPLGPPTIITGTSTNYTTNHNQSSFNKAHREQSPLELPQSTPATFTHGHLNCWHYMLSDFMQTGNTTSEYCWCILMVMHEAITSCNPQQFTSAWASHISNEWCKIQCIT